MCNAHKFTRYRTGPFATAYRDGVWHSVGGKRRQSRRGISTNLRTKLDCSGAWFFATVYSLSLSLLTTTEKIVFFHTHTHTHTNTFINLVPSFLPHFNRITYNFFFFFFTFTKHRYLNTIYNDCKNCSRDRCAKIDVYTRGTVII